MRHSFSAFDFDPKAGYVCPAHFRSFAVKKAKKTKPPPPTITFSELKRLSFCNSKDLPSKVILGGRMKQWVGIGWIDVNEDRRTGKEPVVIEG